MNITCKQCSGVMEKKTETHGFLALFLLIVGVLFLPVFGLGIIVIALALWLGSVKKGTWTCRECGSQIPRKVGFFEG